VSVDSRITENMYSLVVVSCDYLTRFFLLKRQDDVTRARWAIGQPVDAAAHATGCCMRSWNDYMAAIL